MKSCRAYGTSTRVPSTGTMYSSNEDTRHIFILNLGSRAISKRRTVTLRDI